MGCDYYIDKELDITFLNSNGELDYKCITLYTEKGYFYSSNSSDDSDDEQSDFRKNFYHYLDVKYKPRVLFENNKWKSDQVKEKYEHKLIGINNLLKVVKKEVRSFRE